MRVAVTIVLFGAVAAFASCANAEEQPASVAAPPDAATIPEGGVASDAGDTGCALTDAGCPVDPCSGAAFCPVPGAIDARVRLMAISGAAADDVWASGSAGAIIHFDGTTWKPVPSGTTQTLFAIWASSASDVWAGSSRGVIVHGGAAGFARVAPVTPVYVFEEPDGFWPESLIYAAWGTGPGDAWLAGAPYPVYVRPNAHYENQWRSNENDGGVGWLSTTTEPTITVRAIWGSSPADVWLVGTNRGWGNPMFTGVGKSVHSTGDTWSEVDVQTALALTGVWGTSSANVWAVGEKGTLRHFTGGVRWEIVASPTTKDLSAVWGSGPADVWAAGEEGTLIHFDGHTWTLANAGLGPGSTVSLGGIWGSGPDDVWIVGDGVVLRRRGRRP